MLLIFSLLLVIGLGIMIQAQLSLKVGKQEADLAQARNLALSGLVDFRAKIARDPGFPPKLGDQIQPLSYSETLQSRAGRNLGSYQVEVYLAKQAAPHRVVEVKSTGVVGDSKVAVHAYLEYAPGLRWLSFDNEDVDGY